VFWGIEDIGHERQCSLWMILKREVRDIVKVASWSREAGRDEDLMNVWGMLYVKDLIARWLRAADRHGR
jgi:CBS domain containing-hemolysin-like protein